MTPFFHQEATVHFCLSHSALEGFVLCPALWQKPWLAPGPVDQPWVPQCRCLRPGFSQELALAEAARGISVGALQKQGREEQRVPVAAAHFSPLTALDNTTLEDPGLPDISITVPSKASHSPFSRTLRCPNYTAENGLAARKKPQEHPNAALDLASVAPNSWQGHQEEFEAVQHPSSLQPILRSAARYNRVTNGCNTS